MHAFSGAGDTAVRPAAVPTSKSRERDRRAQRDIAKITDHLGRRARGLPSVDPLDYDDYGERLQLKRLGLMRGPGGKLRDDPARAGKPGVKEARR